jgi:D-alanyl-D-alanine carboxypeptidase/D-alanyl-D-alanine-endopeptidase (penicillin-binding protein 4)
MVAGAAALLLAGVAGAHGERGQLARKLARALRGPGLNAARAGAVAVDLKTGRVIFRRHRSLPLAPASNEKLAVTYAALVTLGPAFRFRTAALGDGSQIGGVWHGNLILKGYGDPTLSSHGLHSLARQVRRTGIRRVTGRIVGDESFFDSKRGVKGWKSYYYYEESPPLSALCVDRCVYKGHQPRYPALAAAAAFRQELRSVGVRVAARSVSGRATEPVVQLGIVRSAHLLPTLRFMDRQSDNFTAELLLKQLGAQRGRGTSASGAVVVRRALAQAGISRRGIRIVDGSGLSTLDRLTAGALVSILEVAWADEKLRRPFFSLLPVSGKNGTMRNRLRDPPARGHVHAKTGTTNESSSLSGYVKQRYAFSILHNGHPLATWYAKQAEDRFVSVLARAK